MTLPVLDLPSTRPALPAVLPPDEAEVSAVLAWTAEMFAESLARGRVMATTSFGMEGCALVDLLSKSGLRIPVVYLDTHFFFEETHDLRRTLQQRYPELEFINRGTAITADEQRRRFGPGLWKSDPTACCNLRKVEPMRQVMEGVDVWITGLTRGQGKTRAQLPLVGVDPQYNVIKINPLVSWDRPKVWQYVQDNAVPYNALHEQGYPTVGCTHCTKAVPGSKPWDYTRAGRWAGTEKTECGLHWGEKK